MKRVRKNECPSTTSHRSRFARSWTRSSQSLLDRFLLRAFAATKSQMIEYALDEEEHTELRIKYVEVLQYVFARIAINANGDEIKRILNQEMEDALCMCFQVVISLT